MAEFLYETYVTDEGDVVDKIAFKRFGDSSSTVAILDANPGLAERGPVLARGITILIPVPIQKGRVDGVNLWS